MSWNETFSQKMLSHMCCAGKSAGSTVSARLRRLPLFCVFLYEVQTSGTMTNNSAAFETQHSRYSSLSTDSESLVFVRVSACSKPCGLEKDL